LSANDSEDSEWPLLGDNDSEPEFEDSFEPAQSTAQSIWHAKKNISSIVEPIRDVKTRWNSTYFVLKG
jgi:hypothetical protein